MPEPVKVLIVDDSRIFRSALEQALEGEKDVVVVNSVWSGAKALEKIQAEPPDVVTLDLEMPGLSGLETLQAIQDYNSAHPERPPIGVLVISVHARPEAEITRQARAGGALDCLPKPAGLSVDENLAWLKQAVVPRLRLQASRRTLRTCGCRSGEAPVLDLPPRRTVRAILIAVSTGGPRALGELLPPLCRPIEQPIFVVQHIGGPCCGLLATSLGGKCSHTVIEAEDGDIVQPRTVYLAPADHHLILRPRQGQIATFLTQGPKENNCRPSADVLFRSAALAYGGDVLAVVLTGMGCDGTAGLRPLKRAGAYVIAQDLASCVVDGMPSSAAEAGLVDQMLPLERIPGAIHDLILPKKVS